MRRLNAYRGTNIIIFTNENADRIILQKDEGLRLCVLFLIPDSQALSPVLYNMMRQVKRLKAYSTHVYKMAFGALCMSAHSGALGLVRFY